MNPNSLRKFYGHFHLVHHLQTRIEATNEEFFDELSTHLESLASYSYPVYIMSDFNSHVEGNDYQHSAALLEILQPFDLTQYIHEQTHQLEEIFDLLICDSELQPDDLAVGDISISDHHILSYSHAPSRCQRLHQRS